MTDDRPVRPCPAGCADLADPHAAVLALLPLCSPAFLGRLKLHLVEVQRQLRGVQTTTKGEPEPRTIHRA